MKIALGCDHGGFEAKEVVKKELEKSGFNVLDFGTFSNDSCDYPVFAFAAAESVAKGESDKGILICSSGEGVCICANKVKGIRCGVGYNDEVSHLIVEHNHANMISFGANFMSITDIIRRIHLFLEAVPFEGRHERRVALIIQHEEEIK